jgi:hypothetical protein
MRLLLKLKNQGEAGMMKLAFIKKAIHLVDFRELVKQIAMKARATTIIAWLFIGTVTLYFIYTSAFRYFNVSPAAYGDYWPFAPYLLLHIASGLVALVIGPLQFIPAIRKNHVRLHHLFGKTYLVSIVVASLVSIKMSIGKIIVKENSLVFGTGLLMLAFVWLSCSVMAYWLIRNKHVAQHREWMIRSYVVTLAFVTFRLVTKIVYEGFHAQGPAWADVMAWACWAVPLFTTEVVLQAQKVIRGKKAMTKKKVPVTL